MPTHSDAPANEAEGAKKPKKAPQKWSEAEEILFLEGLDLHGRGWEQV